MTVEKSALALIRTKMQRPQLPGDLVPRRRLVDQLCVGSSRVLTLISAQAGAGKTTLMAQWLEECLQPSAWLSLDEGDNDLPLFLSYFVAAIQTLFPKGCSTTQSLLVAPQTPPLDHLTTTIINEIVDLPEEFVLVLDDYHLIRDPNIHQLVSGLLQYAPPPLHLVILTRRDPPFSTSRLRATHKMAELRMDDLRFAPEEVRAYLELSLGAEVSPEMMTVLATRTEGWAVGLQLACLAYQNQDDKTSFLQTFQGIHRYVMEYLVDEVLSHQPQPIQRFLLCTSVLDRFCAPLGDAVVVVMHPRRGEEQQGLPGQDILTQLERRNLFLVSLDEYGQWYRYHHLFKDLLFRKLTAEITEEQLAKLQIAASVWLDEHEFFEEAFEYALAAKDFDRATQLLETYRHEMMNQEQWPRLKRMLDRLPPHHIEQRTQLLLIKAWHLAVIHNYDLMIPILEQVRTTLDQDTPEVSQERRTIWGGEVAVLWGIISYWLGQGQASLDHTSHTLEVTPPEHAWVVGIARSYQIYAYQILGQLDVAYQEIHQSQAEFGQYNDVIAARIHLSHLVTTILSGNLRGAAEASAQLVALAQPRQLYDASGWGFQTLGYVHYQWNDLEAAERYFSKVLELRYQCAPGAQAHSSFGLALTYRALGRHDEAARLAEEAIEWARGTGNPTMLLEAYSFASRLGLLEGQRPDTEYWVASLSDTFLVMLLIEIPHLTLATTLITRGTPEALQEAADVLARVRQFVEETHNTWRLIEVLSLQALLHSAQGERESALTTLEQAIVLAEPGGFVRLFVDLGPSMARLLEQLRHQGVAADYVSQILAAFAEQAKYREPAMRRTFGPTPKGRKTETESSSLIEPLTPREMEVLVLLGRHLTNKEIAVELAVSPGTVKTHTLNIYRKLDVHRRQQAVARAKELNLL